MKKGFKFLTLLGICGLAGALAACGGNDTPTNTQNPSTTPTITPDTGTGSTSNGSSESTAKPNKDNVDYTVKVKTISGKPVENAFVTFTKGDKEKQVITDETGVAVYNAPKGEYNVSVETPEGYVLSEYEGKTDVAGTPLEFECTTEVIPGLAPKENKYKRFDVMYDFTLTDSKGNKLTLSELLETKKAVILNFWYSGCSNCLQEFPHIEEAYNAKSSLGTKYSDEIAFIAINPVLASQDAEDQKFVEEFKKNWNEGEGLSFDMLTDYNLNDGKPYNGKNYMPALNSFFSVIGYPTTIVIDRDAYIADIIQGGIPDTEKWKGLFETYIKADYMPQWDEDTDGQNGFVKNKAEHPDYSTLNSVVAGNNYDGKKFNATFERETNVNDELYAWPWVKGDDGVSLVPSNLGVDRSFSTIYVNVELKKDEVFTFDINYNIELEKDVLFVIVDDIPVAQITGNSQKTIFAYPAAYDDEYRIGFLYMKDILSSVQDETIALSNFRIEKSTVFDDDKEDTYIYREASSGEYSDYLHKYEHYVDVVFNETDGYFHVGSANGPLLQANLLNPSHFNPEYSLFSMYAASKDPNEWIINNGTNDINTGEIITEYAIYESDSKSSYVPVTKELREALELVVKKFGKEETQDLAEQWLELCVYFDVYGPTKIQMPSPIKGLAPWEAYTVDYETQTGTLYYDRVITNRGYLVEFKPDKSGVYKFVSTTEAKLGGTDLLICDEKLNIIGINDRFTREQAVRYDSFQETANFISYFYYEAGKTYYLRPHYLELLSGLDLNFKYEYLGESYDMVTAAAEEVFTTDIDPDTAPEDTNIEDHIISRAYVTPVIGENGYYVAKNSKAKDTHIYFDAKQTLSVLGNLTFDQLFDLYDPDGNKLPNSAFDFTVDEFGNKRVNAKGEVLMPEKDVDGFDKVDKDGNIIYSKTPMKDKFGNTYVVKDYTDEVKVIVEKNRVKSEDPNYDGLVLVDENLRMILQMLMDKYTFIGVENSWLKLCFYAEHLGK